MENQKPKVKISGYSIYTLVILFFVYIFNFVDRQIISILAENIKADLGISDAQIGFLYGTAFAVFYALFGLPLGRLADTWSRKTLISVGLGFWSLMTALSGTAKSFGALAAYRIGVGIGEASATPAALSMLSDSFPKALRATVMAIYSSGIYVGAGIGIVIGGVVVGNWDTAYPDPSLAPFGLKGWQAAYFVVGVPGLILALWMLTLKEPVRGAVDGIKTEPHPAPFKDFLNVLMSAIPPFTIISLAINNAPKKTIIWNIAMVFICIVLAYILILLTGSVAQWVAYMVAVYATFSWIQGIRNTDEEAFRFLFNNKTFLFSIFGFACLAFVTYGVGFWGAPYFIRNFEIPVAEAGLVLGWSAAIGGCIGVILGGVLSDVLRSKYQSGRLILGMIAAITCFPMVLVVFVTEDLQTAYIFNFIFQVLSPMWIGAATSTAADLVLPRIRAVATALYILVVTLIGLALGPYLIGLTSSTLSAGGMDSADALAQACLMACALCLVAVVFLYMGSRHYAHDEAIIENFNANNA